MAFRVGQKVVCVDADPSSGFDQQYLWCDGEEPQQGGIYTVTSIFISHSVPTLTLSEIRRADECIALGKLGYAARRFRPAVERKTDISIFTKMLTGKKTGVRA